MTADLAPTRRYRSPDDAIRQWCRLQAGLLASVDPCPTVGEQCAKCGAKGARTLVSKPYKRKRYGCGVCYAAWHGMPVHENRYPQKHRRAEVPPSVDERAELGIIVSRLPLWVKRVYVQLYLFEDVGKGDEVEIAREVRTRWERSCDAVLVRDRIREGRTLVEAMLDEKGMIGA